MAPSSLAAGPRSSLATRARAPAPAAAAGVRGTAAAARHTAAAAHCGRRQHHQHTSSGSGSCRPAEPEPAHEGTRLVLASAAGLAAAWSLLGAQQALADAVPPAGPASAYVPGPVEVGWQIWFAAIVSTVPFVIGAYEFGKRILIQRRCQMCGGSGLVLKGSYPKKCPQCGGFFPWISWRMFLSGNARPGNGGPLLQPRGQVSVFYKVPPLPPPPADTLGQQQQQQQGAASHLPPLESEGSGAAGTRTAAGQVE